MQELLKKFEKFEKNQKTEFGLLNQRIDHIDLKVNHMIADKEPSEKKSKKKIVPR